MNAEAFWTTVRQRLDAGLPVFIALVVANTRGSPGTVGARLLIDGQGRVEGTIGGGIMEAKLIEQAKHGLNRDRLAPPILQRLVHRRTGTNNPSGLICAGEQTNLTAILEPRRDGDTVQRFCDALDDTTHRSASLIIDAQGLRVDEAHGWHDAAFGARLIENKESWRYEESSLNPRRLAIVGGGHCGNALARLGADIGYRVAVFDTRAEVLQERAWPAAVRRHGLSDYGELSTAVDHRSLTTVVVMTAAVDHDITALAALASTPPRWLGVMGSRAKIRKIRSALRDRGVATCDIDRIHGPIGLRMKSDTPAEIAVSIIGQLLAEPVTAAGGAS